MILKQQQGVWSETPGHWFKKETEKKKQDHVRAE